MQNTDKLVYQRDEHRVHLIVYHLIWCPRRRKPVLTGDIARRARQIIEEKYKEKGWVILSLAIQPDHNHLFVRVWPSDSASRVVKEVRVSQPAICERSFTLSSRSFHPFGLEVTLPVQRERSVLKLSNATLMPRKEYEPVPRAQGEHRQDATT